MIAHVSCITGEKAAAGDRACNHVYEVRRARKGKSGVDGYQDD